MKFAVANQFLMIADQAGVDYTNVLRAIREDYPRAADLPGPGFAAGPCLFKDTMQLAAFTADHFPLGQAAMQVNEGLPAYIVSALERRYGGLQGKTVGILGMAFKGESDDTRASLSYKLRKLLVVGGRPRASRPIRTSATTVSSRSSASSTRATSSCWARHTGPIAGSRSAARMSSTSGASWGTGSGFDAGRSPAIVGRDRPRMGSRSDAAGLQ